MLFTYKCTCTCIYLPIHCKRFYSLLYHLAANVGLAVGLSVGFFILFFIGVPSFICILVFCLIHKQNRRRTVQTRVITTTPSAGEKTVVTSNQNTSFTTPAPVAAPYPTQQPVYKDAKFSNQDTPPSYDVATTFPQVGRITCMSTCKLESMVH